MGTATMIAQLGRFVVRDLLPWEGPSLFKLTGDPNVTKYMGFRTHETVYDATCLIEKYLESRSKFQAVCDTSNPSDLLGVVGLEVNKHQAALIIMFRTDWKARGAGRRFSIPFVQWIFTHPQIWRVWAYCHVDNLPVQRVLERMGTKREGCLRRFEFFPNVSEEPQDCYVYSIVR